MNRSVAELFQSARDNSLKIEKYEDVVEEIDPEFLNPYAIGHKINHPPPGVSENVILIDFDVPYTWFPSEYRMHLPYADEDAMTLIDEGNIRKNVLRTVAIVAARFIEDGEELYMNYFEEQLVSK